MVGSNAVGKVLIGVAVLDHTVEDMKVCNSESGEGREGYEVKAAEERHIGGELESGGFGKCAV